MKKLIYLFDKHREIVDYLIFGVLTTLVNLVVFYILDTGLNWPYLIANAVAIILSILFAYVTNKLFVFKSKGLGVKENLLELGRFIGFRLVSGGADMAVMWFLVDMLQIDTNLAKLATQFIVVVLNYLFSKLFIFL